MLTECAPRRWWELRGPVAVWTAGGIWESWQASTAHRVELASLEVGDVAARYLDLSRHGDASCVGSGMYRRLPPRPEHVGQMALEL